MRVIVTTGGTGGHVFPALAVAQALRKRHPEAALLFVGARHGREGEWAAAAGFEFAGLAVRGLSGRGLRAVGGGFLMAAAIARALKLVRDFRPDVIAGFGGYASFPALAAGFLAGVPLVVHEQNVQPGLANRFLARAARVVCLSLADEAGVFPARKTVLTGNPVREPLLRLAAESGKRPFAGRHLLILGGSLGARALNDAAVAMSPWLEAAGVQVRHQTGKADFDRICAAYSRLGARHVVVQPFIEDMAGAYAWADLALCRAGATTLAELAVTGTPAFFVPFPFAARQHQVANARLFVQAGAAQMVEEKELGRLGMEAFAKNILALLDDPAGLAAMSQAARRLGHPEAAQKVVDVIESLSMRAPVHG